MQLLNILFIVFTVTMLAVWVFVDDPFNEGSGCLMPLLAVCLAIVTLTNLSLFWVLTMPLLLVYLFCVVRFKLREKKELDEE